MLQKEYNIKIYDLAGNWLNTIPYNVLMTPITYSETINAGQGELRIKLKLDINSSLLAYNNIIKIYESDTGHTARCIYTGIIGNLRRVADAGEQYIEVRAIGLASMLTWLYYYHSAYSFSRSQAPDVTLKEIIDYFGTKYPGLISYTGTSVEAAGTSSNITFNLDKCFDAIKKVVDTASNFWWSIDGQWILQFHPVVGAATSTTHKVTFNKEVESIIVDENTEKLVNSYMLTYGSGSAPTAQDATSITNNGLRELAETQSSINDLGTANTAAANYIAQNKDITRKIQVKINDQYDIESIHAGHFLTINNSDYPVTALQIQKIQYNIDNVELELDYVTSFASEIFT